MIGRPPISPPSPYPPLSHSLAFREPRLQLRELLLRLQQAVQLRQPLGHSALALVELGLGLRQRRRPAVEPGRLLCERSEEHTSELQSQSNLVCRLLLDKRKR